MAEFPGHSAGVKNSVIAGPAKPGEISLSKALKFKKFSYPVGPNHGGASLDTVLLAPLFSKWIRRPCWMDATVMSFTS